MGYGQKIALFVLENQKTRMPKRRCAQMRNGKKKPFCAGKLNNTKRSCAQMGYGKK